MAGEATYTKGIGSSIFTIGYRCQVRIADNTAGSDPKVIGFVDSAELTKQIQTQRAQVLDSIYPASIDAQAINVSGRLTGFLASPSVYKGTESFNGKGEISLASFNPSSDDFVSGTVITKFAYLDFYDEKKELIIASCTTIIPNNFSISMNGGTYVKANISFEAIDMSAGSDYTEETDGETS